MDYQDFLSPSLSSQLIVRYQDFYRLGISIALGSLSRSLSGHLIYSLSRSYRRG